MKTSRKSSSGDKKKLLAIPVLGIVLVIVLATTDWSVLSKSEESALQDVALTSASTATGSGALAERREDTVIANQASTKPKKLGGGKSGKIENWSQVPCENTIDLQPLELDEIVAYDPFFGGPTVIVSAVSPQIEVPLPSPDGSQKPSANETPSEIRNVTAVYIESGRAYAMIGGKVVPVEGHEQLIRRMNQRSMPPLRP